ncbi:MAG: serine hydrolase domain-containing protein [Roseiflexaceae bacterium]|jgi:CubicO group peptidase (beta-lactamase class C family)
MKRRIALVMTWALLSTACSSTAASIADDVLATIAAETPAPITTSTTVTPQHADYTDVNDNVDAFFSEFISSTTPGGVVIVLKDGQIIHQAAYGMANLKQKIPLTVEHQFHLASIGKQMTALGIMMLAEQGKLQYDDRLSTYIPELTRYSGSMTLRQVLNHTAGLPDYDDGVTESLLARSDAPTNDDLITVMSRKRKLMAPPGDGFYYSNVGYDLLAVVIERVSGETYPDFVQTHIFDTLGMTHTFSLPNAKRRKDPLIAISYTGSSQQPEAYPSDNLDGIYGSGSLYSTLGDMALYDAALYGDALVTQKTYKEALKPAQLNDGSREPYGFGLEFAKWHNESYVAHSGAWLGFNNDYVRFAKKHFSVIVLLNRDYDIPDDPRIALQVAQFYLEK